MKNQNLKAYQKKMILLAFVFLAIGLNVQSQNHSETESSIATTSENKDLKWLPAPDELIGIGASRNPHRGADSPESGYLDEGNKGD